MAFRREFACHRCGNPNLEKATVIVERGTSIGTVSGTSYAYGQSVHGTVEVQNQLARTLSADEPRKGVNWIGLIPAVIAMLLICACVGSFMVPTHYIPGDDQIVGPRGEPASYDVVDPAQIAEQNTVFVLSVVAFIAVPILFFIGRHRQNSSYRKKYTAWWWNVLDRRYYCNSCGTIINV